MTETLDELLQHQKLLLAWFLLYPKCVSVTR